MKRVWSFLILILLIITIASATIQVTKISNFKEEVIPGEKISGTISLNISSENKDIKLTSNQGQNTTLKDFLDSNRESDYCTPSDCSSDYSFKNPSNSKTIALSGEERNIGLVLTGSNIKVTSINFTTSSNFQKGVNNPLTIEFFDNKTWKFNKFSSEFTEKEFGCANPSSVAPKDSIIGTTEYCELVNLSETGKIRVGAIVSGDNKDLRMSVYPKESIGEIGSCTYNPIAQEYCEIQAGSSTVAKGEYQVCVSSQVETNYKIHEESVSPTCGFLRNNGPGSSTRDYAIFAESAKFEDASKLSIENSFFQSLVSSANNIIENKYENDCSDSCVFRIKFNGVPQSINVQDLKIRYESSDGLKEEIKFYEINETPAKINFQGILDLSKTNFTISKEGDYILSLGETEILNKEVSFIPVPEIKELSPLNPPAGILVKFSVDASFGKNSSLTYSWDFGDKTKTIKTLNNSATHIYNKTGNYTIKINVSSGNKTNTKSFEINAISPKSAIESTLKSKNNSLQKIISFSNKLPTWTKNGFDKNLNLSSYQTDLTRLSKSYTSAKKDEDYIKIAQELFSIDIPKDILEESSLGLGLFTLKNEINPLVIEELGTGSVEGLESEFQNAILNWQSKNIKANISTTAYTIITDDLNKVEVLRTYIIELNPKEDSFFVINSPKNKLTFKTTDSSTKEVLGSTTLELKKDNKKTIEFYSTNLEELSFYASPSLSTLEVEKNLDESCNFNNICEEGEDYKTCRSDCKPIFWTVFWIIMAIIFTLFIYTLVQIWYKLRYEDHLFGDRRTLYNLLMYIYNARNQGLDDGKIRFELKKKEWSGERITYAINKSHGKSNGLYEIIPIDWLIARYRRNKLDTRYTTPPKQQIMGNINKYPIQGDSRGFK